MPKELADVAFTVTLPEGNPYIGTYTLRLAECTGVDDLDCRRETGYSLVGLMQLIEDDPGLMVAMVSVVVWLARRRDFSHNTFADIARTITWSTDFTFDLDGAADVEVDEGKVQDTDGGS